MQRDSRSSNAVGGGGAGSAALSTVVAVLFLVAFTPAEAGELPTIDEPVNDYVGVYTDAEIEPLNQRLVEHHRQTGVQMAVLVVETTGPEHTIESFSLEVAERWGGGDAERDDGLLFTLAIDDRENRLEVGYGLESAIPDAYAQSALDDIRVLLREERYADATHRVIDDVVTATEHLEPGGERAMHWRTVVELAGGTLVFVVLFSLFVGYAIGRRHLVGPEGGAEEFAVEQSDRSDAVVSPVRDTVTQFDSVSVAMAVGCAVFCAFLGSVPAEMAAFAAVAIAMLLVGLLTEAFFRDSYLWAALSLGLFAAGYLWVLHWFGGFPVVEGPLYETVMMNAVTGFGGAFVVYLGWSVLVFYGAESLVPGRTYVSAHTMTETSRQLGSSGGSSSFGGGGGSFGGGGASGSW